MFYIKHNAKEFFLKKGNTVNWTVLEEASPFATFEEADRVLQLPHVWADGEIVEREPPPPKPPKLEKREKSLRELAEEQMSRVTVNTPVSEIPPAFLEPGRIQRFDPGMRVTIPRSAIVNDDLGYAAVIAAEHAARLAEEWPGTQRRPSTENIQHSLHGLLAGWIPDLVVRVENNPAEDSIRIYIGGSLGGGYQYGTSYYIQKSAFLNQSYGQLLQETAYRIRDMFHRAQRELP